MRHRIYRKRGQLTAYLIVALMFAIVAYIGDTSRRALCFQRAETDRSIALTDTYLHPKTAKQRRDARRVFAAIPRATIVDGQKRRKEFRKNLDVVICSWSEVLP